MTETQLSLGFMLGVAALPLACLDLRQVMHVVNVDGGVDVRFYDFARPGDVSLAGDPRALLDAWRRRLGR
jgi:hypothetical protein